MRQNQTISKTPINICQQIHTMHLQCLVQVSPAWYWQPANTDQSKSSGYRHFSRANQWDNSHKFSINCQADLLAERWMLISHDTINCNQINNKPAKVNTCVGVSECTAFHQEPACYGSENSIFPCNLPPNHNRTICQSQQRHYRKLKLAAHWNSLCDRVLWHSKRH